MGAYGGRYLYSVPPISMVSLSGGCNRTPRIQMSDAGTLKKKTTESCVKGPPNLFATSYNPPLYV